MLAPVFLLLLCASINMAAAPAQPKPLPPKPAPTKPVTKMPGAPSMHYAIIMDAGSTGVRANFFAFNCNPSLHKPLNLTTFGQDEKTDVSLAMNVHSPQTAYNKIKVLLQNEIKFRHLKKNTDKPSLLMRGTAGLRLLKRKYHTLTQHLLTFLEKNIRHDFNDYFVMPKDGRKLVDVLSGQDEAIYSWLALHFLIRSEGKKMKVGILEVGGASFQAAYPVSRLVSLPHDADALTTLKVGPNFKQRLYGKSYLRYGLTYAHLKIIGTSDHCIKGNCSTKPSFKSPCMPAHFIRTVKFNTGTIVISGDSNSALTDAYRNHFCYRSARKYVKHGGGHLKKLHDTHGVNFHGVSAFVYGLVASGAAKKNPAGIPYITPLGIKQAAENACKSANLNSKKGKYDVYYCPDFWYLYSLVSDGLKLEPNRIIFLRNKVGGVELGWALGIAIKEVYKQHGVECPFPT